MEITIDKKEFQKISAAFRRYASRLLRTSASDGLDNLKRFLNVIEETPLIWDFIEENNNKKFDIENEVKSREFMAGYDIPINPSEEIAYVYQLLRYCADKCDDYWRICIHYSSSNKFQDHIDAFNNRVVHPFISHIEGYLRERWIDLGEEGKIQITVNGGQVAIAQDNSTINATQNNNYGETENLIKYIEEYKKTLKELQIDDEVKEETIELLDAATDEAKADKPKKAIIKTTISKINEVAKFGANVASIVKLSDQIIDLLSTYIM